MLKLILGLGNIGKKYQGTRHNVGFEVVDRLAERLRATWLPREKEYDWAQVGTWNSELGTREESTSAQSPVPSPQSRIILAKPRTYMNLSGLASKKLLETLNLTSDQMLVIVDDLALPLGAVRIRGKGSDGGHNGLTSIIEELGTQSFPRIRLGIGQLPNPPEKSGLDTSPSSSIPESQIPSHEKQKSPKPVDKEADIIDYVLGQFGPEERPAVDKMVAHAADAVLFAIEHRLDETMSKYNYNPALPESP